MVISSVCLLSSFDSKKRVWPSNAPIKSKLQHPPPGKPRAFDYFLCPGSGEFDMQDLLRGGDLTFVWVWWGKLTESVRFQFFFFRAPKSLTAISTCLEEVE